MSIKEIITYPIKDLQDSIRNKTISVEELTNLHINQIKSVNQSLNAVVQNSFDSAIKTAKFMDNNFNDSNTKPLFGLPFTLKDSVDTKGIISTWGTEGRTNFIPKHNATVAERLINAGGILMGKTNTPEFTMGGETDNVPYGRTNNPYNLNFTTGGSSGGAAAIISACGSVFDLGTDTGGSIRMPAHHCGISGLKPTFGRVPRTGHAISFDAGPGDLLTSIGPLARFVDDLIPLTNIISGPDNVDPTVVISPLNDPSLISTKNLKVGFYHSTKSISSDNDTKNVINTVCQKLEPIVQSINEIDTTIIERGDSVAGNIANYDKRNYLKQLLDRSNTKTPHRWTKARFDIAEEYNNKSAIDLSELIQQIAMYQSESLSYFDNYDVLIAPVLHKAGFKHGEIMDTSNKDWNYVTKGTFLRAYNVTGWPVLTLRCGTNTDGYPIGLQIITAPWKDEIALKIGQILEKELGGWIPPKDMFN